MNKFYQLRGYLFRCEYSTEELLDMGYTVGEIKAAKLLNDLYFKKMEVSGCIL